MDDAQEQQNGMVERVTPTLKEQCVHTPLGASAERQQGPWGLNGLLLDGPWSGQNCWHQPIARFTR